MNEMADAKRVLFENPLAVTCHRVLYKVIDCLTAVWCMLRPSTALGYHSGDADSGWMVGLQNKYRLLDMVPGSP